MSGRRISTSRLKSVACVLASLCVLYAVPNLGAQVPAGLTGTPSVESMLKQLHETRDQRAAARIRSLMVGTPAPRLRLQQWLANEPTPPELAWPVPRVTCLYFWQDTCGPCIASFPETNELAAWIKSRGGVFLSIHLAGADPNALQKFIRGHALQFPVALDSDTGGSFCWGSATFESYGVDGTPTYVIIGPDGVVLTYARPSKTSLEKIFSAPRERKEMRPGQSPEPGITTMPQAWNVVAGRPRLSVRSRLLLYRPDTPDLALEVSRSPGTPTDREPVMVKLNRHADADQTVYEAVLDGTSPDWGQNTSGEVRLSARYGSVREVLKLRYSIGTVGLVQLVPSTIFFGMVAEGQTVTRTVTATPRDKISNIDLEIVSAPPSLEATISRGEKDADMAVQLRLSAPAPGFHKGVLLLRASDNQGNSQRIELEFSASVCPAAGED